MIRVGFTGTRFGATEVQRAAMRRVLDELVARSPGETFVAHHGDCVGADAEFHAIARALGWTVVVHPPVGDDDERAKCVGDETREPLTHMKRNKAIVTEARVMLAVSKDMTEQEYGGTWKTIRMARKAKRPLVIVFPDGSTEGEWP